MPRIVSQKPHGHFVKNLGDAKYTRLLLPGMDGVGVKVTKFQASKGWKAKGICYPCDETVYVQEGVLHILDNTKEVHIIEKGCVFHAQAGAAYDLTVLENVTAICVFSPSVGLPEDEEVPSPAEDEGETTG